MTQITIRSWRGSLHPVWSLVTAGLCVCLFGSSIQAAESETRTFAVWVDGKKAGQCEMKLDTQEGGQVTVSANVNVKVSIFYKYAYSGVEIWKAGRLQSLRSSTNDNGKKFQVAAVQDTRGLRVQVNGKERMLPAQVWTKSFWRLPDANVRGKELILLDPDNGAAVRGQLKFIGKDNLTVAGQKIIAAHYRVTGGKNPVDLWYDGSDRLLRQDFVEDGHKTVTSLTGISKN